MSCTINSRIHWKFPFLFCIPSASFSQDVSCGQSRDWHHTLPGINKIETEHVKFIFIIYILLNAHGRVGAYPGTTFWDGFIRATYFSPRLKWKYFIPSWSSIYYKSMHCSVSFNFFSDGVVVVWGGGYIYILKKYYRRCVVVYRYILILYPTVKQEILWLCLPLIIFKFQSVKHLVFLALI